MKLFWCSTCVCHYNTAQAYITIPSSVRIDEKEKFYIHDFEMSEHEVIAPTFRCGACGSGLQIVSLKENECSHNWKQYLKRDKYIRKCRLCGKEEERKVEWD